jgi:Protein of unknown function (DUF3302)
MDVFDIIAFVVFGVLVAAAVIVVVVLGSLPGRVAWQRGHPQAAAITVAGWLGLATLGILWPVALIWAFLQPRSAVPLGATERQEPRPAPGPDPQAELVRMKSRVAALEGALRDLQAKKEAGT